MSCDEALGRCSMWIGSTDHSVAQNRTCLLCVTVVVLLHRLCGRKGGSTRPQDIGELLRLRQQMGHLITNLQVYLQLDVIEANFDWLEHQVAAAQVGPAHTNKAVHRHGVMGRSLALAAADASLGKLCCLQANRTERACQWYR